MPLLFLPVMFKTGCVKIYRNVLDKRQSFVI